MIIIFCLYAEDQKTWSLWAKSLPWETVPSDKQAWARVDYNSTLNYKDSSSSIYEKYWSFVLKTNSIEQWMFLVKFRWNFSGLEKKFRNLIPVNNGCSWRRRFLKGINLFSTFSYYLVFEKDVVLHFNKIEYPSPYIALCKL